MPGTIAICLGATHKMKTLAVRARMTRTLAAAFAGAALTLALVAEAHALNSRTWVSGSGTDQAGCGPLATPCRTMQYAHDNTVPGGEIDVKDAAGYGTLTITKSITVFNDGVGTAGLLSATGNVVTVNAAPSDKIVLRGLTIEGLNSAANGIAYVAGGQLVVDRCTFGGFPYAGQFTTGNGILVRPASGSVRLSVSDSLFTNSGYNAILAFPASGTPNVSINVDRATIVGNFNGIGGLSNDAPNSVIAINVTHSNVSQNSSYGLWLQGVARMTIGDTVVSKNDTGVSNASNPNGMYSFGNNMVSDNTTDFFGSMPSAKALH